MAGEIQKSSIQYLDMVGLQTFLNNLKEYINIEITKINGSNLKAYEEDTDNPLYDKNDPTKNNIIADQLQALWDIINNLHTTSESGLTTSYANGKLTINSTHTHAVTLTESVSNKSIEE